jgi:DNA repair protein RadC
MSHALKAARQEARREERERLARLFEDTSNRLAWTPQEIADTIRSESVPEEERDGT